MLFLEYPCDQHIACIASYTQKCYSIIYFGPVWLQLNCLVRICQGLFIFMESNEGSCAVTVVHVVRWIQGDSFAIQLHCLLEVAFLKCLVSLCLELLSPTAPNELSRSTTPCLTVPYLCLVRHCTAAIY